MKKGIVAVIVAFALLAGAGYLVASGTQGGRGTAVYPVGTEYINNLRGQGKGSAYGYEREVETFSAATTVTCDDCGKLFIKTGTAAAVLGLPDISSCSGGGDGWFIDVANSTAYTCDVNPYSTDQILGLTNAGGDAIRSTTAGGFVRITGLTATTLSGSGSYGTWSDVN